ncbi:MAG: fumarylacetoacetate hydrolase family protein [Actinobacteria bacterium]|nr:fumarylacetoacetate hydrolase family protein [Actinomycetota bacterium]
MRLLSFGENGSSVAVLCHDQTVVDISGAIPDSWERSRGLMRAVISNFESLRGGIEKLASEGNGVPLDSLTLTAPVPDPSKIVAAPVNYLDHMTEMNQASHIDSLGVFLKAPSSLIGHRGTVRLPYSDRRFDQEGELCFVISRQARNVKADNAFDYIFGFSIALDITMRGGEDRSTRKSFDTFTPMGPWILTSDEINSLADLQLRCWVNDELRQQAKISQLIWGVPELLEYVSSVMTLLPGDIISTGTPAGVGPIDSGDVIVAEVSEIGRLKVHVSDQGATLSVTKGAATGALGLQGMKQS